jgi:hypothetical protein
VGATKVQAAFTAANQIEYFYAQQSNNAGAGLTVSTSCTQGPGPGTPPVASTAPLSGTASSSFPITNGSIFTITAGGAGGTCVVTVSGANNQSAVIFVGVSITNGSVS